MLAIQRRESHAVHRVVNALAHAPPVAVTSFLSMRILLRIKSRGPSEGETRLDERVRHG